MNMNAYFISVSDILVSEIFVSRYLLNCFLCVFKWISIIRTYFLEYCHGNSSKPRMRVDFPKNTFYLLLLSAWGVLSEWDQFKLNSWLEVLWATPVVSVRCDKKHGEREVWSGRLRLWGSMFTLPLGREDAKSFLWNGFLITWQDWLSSPLRLWNSDYCLWSMFWRWLSKFLPI